MLFKSFNIKRVLFLLIIICLLPKINIIAQNCVYDYSFLETFSSQPNISSDFARKNSCLPGGNPSHFPTGSYTYVSNANSCQSNLTGIDPSGSGLFLLVNGTGSGLQNEYVIWSMSNISIKSDVNYSFSAQVINVNTTAWYNQPILTLQIIDNTGAVLAAMNSGEINEHFWIKLAIDKFTSSQDRTVTIKVLSRKRNEWDGNGNQNEAHGNDFGIDNIEFKSVPVPINDYTVSYPCMSGFPDIKAYDFNPSDTLNHYLNYKFLWFNEKKEPILDSHGNQLYRNILPAQLAYQHRNPYNSTVADRQPIFYIKAKDKYGCISGFKAITLANNETAIFEENFDDKTHSLEPIPEFWPLDCLGGHGTRDETTNPRFSHNNPDWFSGDDNTPGNGTKMLLVDMIDGDYRSTNGCPVPHSGSWWPVWKTTLNVNYGKSYRFVVYAKNAMEIRACYEPKLELYVTQGSLTRVVPGTFNKLEIGNGWMKIEGIWTATSNNPATFEIKASVGNEDCNDFVLDDISISTTHRLTKPTVTQMTLCDVNVGHPITLTANGKTSTGTYKWYSDAYNTNTLLATQDVYSGNITKTTSYWVTSWDPTSGCESERVELKVTVNQRPIVTITWPALPVNPDNGKSEIRAGATYKPIVGNQNNPSSDPFLPIATYSWNWGDGKTSMGKEASHVYDISGRTYRVRLTIADANGCSFFYEQDVYVYSNLCDTYFPPGDGSFKKVNPTGGIAFVNENCSPKAEYSFDCMSVPGTSLSNVVSATATSYIDSLILPDANDPEKNPFLRGHGNWHPRTSFTYNAPLSNNENFRAGTFNLAYPFNFHGADEGHIDAWIPAGRATLYAPNGEAVEERNVLNIASAVKFGYNFSLPYVTAQNADFKSILFDSFEKTYQIGGKTCFEDNLELKSAEGVVDNLQFHSGGASLKLNSNTFTLKPITSESSLISKGLTVKLWVKVTGGTSGQMKLKFNNHLVDFNKIAQNGSWSLFSCSLTASQIYTLLNTSTNPGGGEQLRVIQGPETAESNIVTPAIVYSGGASGDLVWLDDLRIQPLDAQATAYVYDTRSQNLLTSFDDQHFGLYYQYNSEGKLVRKLIETEQGLKTIEETQYNTPKVNRPNGF